MLAVVTALQMVVESGDNIVIVSPVWPNIFKAARIAGAEPRLVRLEEDWNAGHWRLDLDKLFDACDARTKALFLASPGNPTGWMMTGAEQKAILEFARARGIAIIGDEVYGTLIYDGTAHAPSWLTLAEPDDMVFVINSFSKPWAMTGWRIGWLVHPLQVATAATVMAQTGNTGTTHFLQLWRDRGAIGGRRCVPWPVAGTLPGWARSGGRFHRAPEPGALDEAGWRILWLPECRWPEGQSGLRAGPGEDRESRRRPRLGLQPGRSAR